MTILSLDHKNGNYHDWSWRSKQHMVVGLSHRIVSQLSISRRRFMFCSTLKPQCPNWRRHCTVLRRLCESKMRNWRFLSSYRIYQSSCIFETVHPQGKRQSLWYSWMSSLSVVGMHNTWGSPKLHCSWDLRCLAWISSISFLNWKLGDQKEISISKKQYVKEFLEALDMQKNKTYI